MTTVDLGGGLTLISAGSNSVLADHTGGNDVFARQGAVVVATENAARRMADPFPSPRGGFDPPVPVNGRPKETFRDARSVAVEGQRAELKALAPSHTDGDAYVHFAAANVLVMGDLHHSNEYPVYDAQSGCRCGSYEGNLRAYDEMLAAGNDRTTYIPGHGGPTTKTEVAAYVAMLRRIRNQVGAMIAQGRTSEEVVAASLLADDRSPTTPGPDNRDQFIRTLYEPLKSGQGR